MTMIQVYGEIGTRVMLDEQEYVLIRVETYLSQTAEPFVEFAVWRTHCLECGREFEVSAVTGRIDFNRRCEEHHKPGRRCQSPTRRSLRYSHLSDALRRLVAADDALCSPDGSAALREAALALDLAGEGELAAEASRLAGLGYVNPGPLTHHVRRLIWAEIWPSDAGLSQPGGADK